MGDPTKRGKKIVTATYNATAVGVCLSWNFSMDTDYHPQPNEDSTVDDAQLMMHQSVSASLEMIHTVPGDSQTSHALSITERLGDGTTRAIALGNHVIKSISGAHPEGGVTSFTVGFISIGAITVPAAA